mgnify:CR=1 FL=1
MLDFKKNERGIELSFQVEGEALVKHTQADLVVGAGGILSAMRRLLIGEDASPLRYLGCIVIFGICPLDALQAHKDVDGSVLHPLFDGATVFQTANGHERIYMMPYDST